MPELQGKSPLATGGTSRIRRAVALALAKLGAHMVISNCWPLTGLASRTGRYCPSTIGVPPFEPA